VAIAVIAAPGTKTLSCLEFGFAALRRIKLWRLFMKKLFLAAALLSSVASCSCPAYAQSGPAIQILPPIYPTQEQQTGAMWGTTETVACPDGFKLLFEGQPPTPICIAMTPQELSGGAQ
jgi:hypothetical protein